MYVESTCSLALCALHVAVLVELALLFVALTMFALVVPCVVNGYDVASLVVLERRDPSIGDSGCITSELPYM